MLKWQVFCAVALRRMPELARRRDDIELKVQGVFSAYELAKSKFSDHEMQHLEDLKAKESEEIEVIIKETAQDREDAWNKEREKFKPQAYDDKLSHVHYLFAKQKFGSDPADSWLLPQSLYNPEQDESLYDTGRRAMKDTLGVINGYTIVSKIPSSVYSRRYSKKISALTSYDGSKVFFLKAHLDLPSKFVLDCVDDKKHGDKLKWLTRSEAMNHIKPIEYMKKLNYGLFHDDWRVDTGRVLDRAAEYASANAATRQQLKTRQQQQSLQ